MIFVSLVTKELEADRVPACANLQSLFANAHQYFPALVTILIEWHELINK